jgi:hypothetical protein
MERQFLTDLEQSEEIRPHEWRRRSWLHRTADSIARRLAPVL